MKTADGCPGHTGDQGDVEGAGYSERLLITWTISWMYQRDMGLCVPMTYAGWIVLDRMHQHTSPIRVHQGEQRCEPEMSKVQVVNYGKHRDERQQNDSVAQWAQEG